MGRTNQSRKAGSSLLLGRKGGTHGFADEGGLVLVNQFHAALGTITRSGLDHFGMHAARVSVDVPAAVLV